MSFSPLDVYGEMMSEEMTTKTNFINEETGQQCTISSKPERICDTLVNILLHHYIFVSFLKQYQDFGV